MVIPRVSSAVVIRSVSSVRLDLETSFWYAGTCTSSEYLWPSSYVKVVGSKSRSQAKSGYTSVAEFTHSRVVRLRLKANLVCVLYGRWLNNCICVFNFNSKFKIFKMQGGISVFPLSKMSTTYHQLIAFIFTTLVIYQSILSLCGLAYFTNPSHSCCYSPDCSLLSWTLRPLRLDFLYSSSSFSSYPSVFCFGCVWCTKLVTFGRTLYNKHIAF